MLLKDLGWVWEGQGLHPQVEPSIFGVGEGCQYFGLSRACYMFHPHTELAMNKLAGLDEVICDISKWKFDHTEDGATYLRAHGALEVVKAEAALVSRLAGQFPNITGAIHDDMRGLVKRENLTAERYTEVYAALKGASPDLKLWTVVYTSELDPEEWVGFEPFTDVVNLWEWHSENIPRLNESIARCRELFPGKPIVMGCYLRDYGADTPVAMDLLKLQWECLLRHLEEGTLDGYSIIATVLIDGHQEQANWVRDLIAANS